MMVKSGALSAMRIHERHTESAWLRFAAATPQETDYTPRDFISRYCTVNC